MKIGILLTGHAPDELRADFGDYDLFFARLLGRQYFEYVTYAVVDGVFPSGVDAADAWLITGSKHSVNDPYDWVSRLEELLRLIYASDRPMVGICFGHQMIAKALGGKVEQSANGWIAGPTTYSRSDLGTTQTLFAWHQDQVTVAPPAATLVSDSEGCRFAMFRYGNRALSYQAHPEFTADFVKGLVTYRGATLPDTVRANVAQAEDKMVSRAAVADEMRGFLLRSLVLAD